MRNFPTKREKCLHVNQYQVPSGMEKALKLVVRAPLARSEIGNVHKILFGEYLRTKSHEN